MFELNRTQRLCSEQNIAPTPIYSWEQSLNLSLFLTYKIFNHFFLSGMYMHSLFSRISILNVEFGNTKRIAMYSRDSPQKTKLKMT